MRTHMWPDWRTRPTTPCAPKEKRRCANPDCKAVLASDNKDIYCSPCGGREVWEGAKPGRGATTNREFLALAALLPEYEVPEEFINRYMDARSCRGSLQSSINHYELPLRARVEGERVWIERAPLAN